MRTGDMVGLFEALFGVAGFGLIAIVVFRIGRAAPRMEPASLLQRRVESTTAGRCPGLILSDRNT